MGNARNAILRTGRFHVAMVDRGRLEPQVFAEILPGLAD